MRTIVRLAPRLVVERPCFIAHDFKLSSTTWIPSMELEPSRWSRL